MLEQLQRDSAVISLEAQSGKLSEAVGRLPDFFSGLKSAFTKYLAQPLSHFFTRHDITWFAREVQKVEYVGLREVEVFTPAGLKTDYLTYAQTLTEATKAAQNLKANILVPFNKWLGAKLGSPSSLNALTGNLNIAGYHPHELDKLNKALNACFVTDGKLEVTALYGKVVKRNGDWSTLSKEVTDLLQAFSDAHHKEIVGLVNEASSLMDTLLRRIEEEPEVYKLSPTTLTALSEVAYQLGAEIEFYGLLRHRVDEFGKALDDSINKLEGFTK